MSIGLTIGMAHHATDGISLGAWLQIIATAIAAVAAVAAWFAATAARNGALAGKETAEATREATATAQEAARQARIGYQITFHAGRLEALADLHRFVSWVTEGGRPRKELTWSERHLVVTGIPKPTTIVEGYELKGMIAATGRDLPACAEIANLMTSRMIKGAPVGRALEELYAAMADENRILASLEAELVQQASTRSG
jgi:hypothetical protein